MTELRGRFGTAGDWALTLLLTLLVLGPVLVSSGYVLAGDMVFVPDQPWKDAWTGGDGGVPRAVPSDAWVALLDDVVPGQVLQRLVLVGILVGAGTGTARLLSGLPGAARAVGVVAYLWNPYVHERLAIGHWALLLGYAALPWAVHAVLALRRGAGTRGWAQLAVAMAVAGWSSPSGGLLVVLVAVVLAWSVPRLLGRVLLLGTWVNLPWIVPAFLNGADQLPADPFGVAAFAARADTPYGVVGSLLTFGGIWKESIHPDDRGHPLLAAVALGLVVLAVAGLWLRRRDPVVPPVPALVLGTGALLLAGLSAFSATRGVVEWIVVEVPGGGLLRDSQKLVLPWLLVASTGLASFVAWLVPRVERYGAHARLWLGVVAALPLLALPGMSFGLGGFLQARDYPDDWFETRARMERLGVTEDAVAVLPFSTYRRFDWTPRTVLDPAPRFFPGRMITDDALVVRSGTVGGESRVARTVRLSSTPEELAAALEDAGVRWVLLHRTVEEPLLPAGARLVHAGDQLALLDLGERSAPASETSRATWYAVMDTTVLAGTVAFVVVSIRRSRILPARGY